MHIFIICFVVFLIIGAVKEMRRQARGAGPLPPRRSGGIVRSYYYPRNNGPEVPTVAVSQYRNAEHDSVPIVQRVPRTYDFGNDEKYVNVAPWFYADVRWNRIACGTTPVPEYPIGSPEWHAGTRHKEAGAKLDKPCKNPTCVWCKDLERLIYRAWIKK